jgi:opacity protein-like surface antigen
MVAGMFLVAPAKTQADWLFTPSIGGTFGGDTFGENHLTYAGALTWLDAEMFGWEAEFSYSPEFFDVAEVDGDRSGSVLTLMGNVVIGAPLGGPDGRLRPYLTGGVGLMRMRVLSDAETFETTTSEAGFNLGAGAMAMFSERVGLRGDVRYLRSFQDQNPSWTRGIVRDIAPGSFDFWRASLGVTVFFPQQ